MFSAKVQASGVDLERNGLPTTAPEQVRTSRFSLTVIGRATRGALVEEVVVEPFASQIAQCLRGGR